MRDLFSTWVLLPLFLLLLVSEVSGQDMRGVLAIDSWSPSFSFSRSGRVWMMTDKGLLYSASSLNDAWTREPRVTIPDAGIRKPSSPWFGDVVYVSETDSLLIVSQGDYFIMRDYSMRLLRSTDRGRSWSVIPLPRDSSVICIEANDQGRMWAGTAYGAILYSSDEGWTWSVVHAPSTDSSQVTSIMMTDSLHGIAGTTRDILYVTADNWKTTRVIRAPRTSDQDDDYTDPREYRIEQVFLLGRSMIVTKPYQSFYCDIDDTVWHEFAPQTDRLAYDRSSQRFLGITSKGSVVSFQPPIVVDTLVTDDYLRSNDQIIVNNTSIAILVYNTLRFVERGSLRTIVLLCNDVRAATPTRTIRLKNGVVGLDRYFVYYSSTGADSTWERKVMLPKEAWQLIALNDSVVIVGSSDGYMQVNVRTWHLSAYKPHRPISSFLAPGIAKISLAFKSEACFVKPQSSFISFSRLSSGDLACDTWTDGEEEIEYHDTISMTDLLKGFDRFNEDPYRVTTMKQLDFSAHDIDSFLVGKKRWLNEQNLSQVLRYDTISAYAHSLLTLDPDTPFLIEIDRRGSESSTNRAIVAIVIVNTKNDTLTLGKQMYGPYLMYPLPLSYSKLHFQLMDPTILYCIEKALPNGCAGKYLFARTTLVEYLVRQMMQPTR